MTLSVVMVTYNSMDVVEGAMRSIKGLGDELLIGDGGSSDGTVEIVKRYGGVIIRQIRPILPIRQMNETMVNNDKNGGMRRRNLGVRKQELVERAKGDWILVLDADERVSGELKEEIASITHPPRRSHALRLRSGLPPSEVGKHAAFRIPYQNYVFGRPVYYGGEKYAKVRLFRQGFARISPEPLHEEIIINKYKKYSTLDPRLRGDDKKGRGDDNRVGALKGVIHHHSYRSPIQLFSKFTRYAWTAAGVKNKKEAGSRVKPGMTMERLFLYGPHMFWARFIKEQGYKDGWRGLILALAFGYMEGLMYWLVFIRSLLAVLQGETLKHL